MADNAGESPPPNFANQTIWTRDNIEVLRGMNSASVDLIYLDPPFNSNTNYAAPIGSEAAGAAFKDTWSLSDVDVEWINLIEAKHPTLYRVLLAAMTDSDKSYLAYMAARLIEMRRLLKPSGSIYLHCDPTMSHYLKLVMDAIYGRRKFRNELIWQYRRWPAKQRNFQRMHDVILRYAKGDDVVWNQLFDPLSETTLKRIKGGKKIVTFHDEETGKKRIRPTSERSKGSHARRLGHKADRRPVPRARRIPDTEASRVALPHHRIQHQPRRHRSRSVLRMRDGLHRSGTESAAVDRH